MVLSFYATSIIQIKFIQITTLPFSLSDKFITIVCSSFIMIRRGISNQNILSNWLFIITVGFLESANDFNYENMVKYNKSNKLVKFNDLRKQEQFFCEKN